MADKITCPHCGEPIDLHEEKVKVSKYVLKGAVTGLIAGAVFDYFYFYIGVITDFFSFMPVIHLIAGILLGGLAGWILGEKKNLARRSPA